MSTESLSTRIAQIASLSSYDGGGKDTTKIVQMLNLLA